MGRYLFPFLAALLLVAVLLQEDFVISLFYLLFGTYLVSRWWGRHVLEGIHIQRRAPGRMFLGEQARVSLEVTNRSWLPAVWLQVHESLPAELALAGALQQVVSLGPKGHVKFEYWLSGRRRGCYSIGPLSVYSGDIFGVVDQSRRSFSPEQVTVFPQIVPLARVSIPSSSPLGTIQHSLPIYEDPSRVIGKRDYTSGDSQRRVDWKSTASIGRLLVKKCEPSIALETELLLNLNSAEYNSRRSFGDSELAIVVAASLANWIVTRRQAVGLATNGIDPHAEAGIPLTVPPRRGRGHLVRILEVLARVQLAETYPLEQLLRQQRVRLPWGATQLLITPSLDDAAFDALFQAQRSGVGTLIVLVGGAPGYQEIRQRANYFGFPLFSFQSVEDLDIWRR